MSQLQILPFEFILYKLQLTEMQKEKTVEEIYQKKTPLEHILLRPDTYIGTVEPSKQQKWILQKGQPRFTCKEITYTPGFYKIFDEVLVNAADNYQRDKKMNQLNVQINQEKGFIRVMNNGKGIPIVIHKQHKIYVPELIFGHLLTGSNYNDDEKRIVGGRNGYGAKLANVFSDKFIVECGDYEHKKKFKMVWKDNMKMHDEGQILPYNGKDFVAVTFYPCFKLFNMKNGLDDDIFALMSKRVYDMAGILPKVKVTLNEKQIDIKSFSEYVDMYFDQDSSPQKIFDRQVNTDRWEVIVSITDGEFKQVSFVNGVCTSKGGTHVNFLLDQIVEKVQEKIKKKEKDLEIKPFQIKAHIWIFVNCLVENPTFDTQTKETLTLKASQFGSKCELSDKMIKDILKLGIVDTVIQIAKAKAMTKLAKVTGGQKKTKLTGIPKLEDANEAGTRNSDKCTLILTQGDSAKALAMSGLAVIGRDYFGVFPLKGKLLNVREANTKQLSQNQQITNLIKIIGLTFGKKYEDVRSLRYGSIMIMSDQDTDGSHIKGLVINFIHNFWPTLFQMPGFVKQFITPLLKVTKGNQRISFYTMNDFKEWVQRTADLNTWTIKYYKGLGTSDDKEAKQYFSDLRKHRIDFQYVDNQDDDAIELIFSKKRVEDRKTWLSGYDPKLSISYDRPRIRYKEFVDRQFIHFSNEDNFRSIGSLIDGFKPGQRKILFGCFKRRLTKEVKVAQLSGYIAENSAYHHGQMSLVQTIIGMAQNYVGSNNVNLLMPNGQFGSRNLGGKDHASARYIFTALNRVSRLIFPQPDDHVLTYVEDDGQIVEPEYYIPIIPMILVNGCQGIGTGWSTFIPNFNPRELCNIIKQKIKGEDFPILHPWYKNYTGEIVPNEGLLSYTVTGNCYIDESKENTIIIDELPIMKWTKDFKLNLDDIMSKGQEQIVGLRQYHTKDKVHFEIEMNENFFRRLYETADNTEKFVKYFKLQTSISLKNLVGFNQQLKLVKMPSINSILDNFYNIRLTYYEKRKDYLVSRIVRDLAELQEKQRFIVEVVQEIIQIRKVKKLKICQTLRQRKFLKYSELPKVKSTKVQPKQKPKKQVEDEDQKDKDQDPDAQVDPLTLNQTDKIVNEYNYLLSLPLLSLSQEKVREIQQKRSLKQKQLEKLSKTPIQNMWVEDIDRFLVELDKVEAKQKADREKEDEQMRKNLGKGKVQKAKKKQVKKEHEKKQKGYDWDSENQTEQSDFGGIKKPPKKFSRQNKVGKDRDDSKHSKDQIKKVQTKEIKKQKLQTKKQQSEPNDLMSRLKKKMSEAPDQYLTTKPVQKQLTMEEIFSQSKRPPRQQEYDVVPNPNKKRPERSSKSKKKMVLDSDEEEEIEYSEYHDSNNDDEDFE